MDWSKGYSASFYAAEVDPATWRDIRLIEITGGTVKRTPSGLRNSATIDCPKGIGRIETWIRIYMDASQDGDYAHEAVFTGIAASPKRRAYASRSEQSPDCYSVLKPADDILLPRGWFAPAGNSGDIIRDLLSVSPAPVVVEDGAPALSATIIAEESETRLTMVDKILEAIDWRIDIAGDGTVNIRPRSNIPVATFDPSSFDVIEAPIDIVEDWYSAPNVFMAVADGLTGIARDENVDSPLSIQSRGREVWKQESGVNLSDRETIADYAARRLRTAQQVKKQAQYDRRFVPHVRVGDAVNMHYPAQNFSGIYTITSQSIKLGHHAKTSETAEEL